MFTLAHLSDPHLPLPRARPRELLGKRFTGYVNWWRGRARLHQPQALGAIVADLRAQAPDHIALTGDLVNISLPGEFRLAQDWLEALGGPADVTLVPGNHDVYVATAWPQSLGLWGRYMAGDGQPAAAGFDVFPFVRRRWAVALVGLSSGVPKPPFFATGTLGAAQLERTERLLAELDRAGLCRVVLIHHPPLLTVKRLKRLTDAAAFQAMLGRVGCELVLHGHDHRSELGRIAGPDGPIPVVGVASASSAAGGRYGRARYHLLRFDAAGAAWNIAIELRSLRPDGTGCEADGVLNFRVPRRLAMVA
jgi:3',5'-cyclic AMP phosphodiesterase CpdA